MSGTSQNRLIVVGEERQSSDAQVVIFKSVWLSFVAGGINGNLFFSLMYIKLAFAGFCFFGNTERKK